MTLYFHKYNVLIVLHVCRLLNRQTEEWGDKVSVVSCDMRKWEAPEKVIHMYLYGNVMYIYTCTVYMYIAVLVHVHVPHSEWLDCLHVTIQAPGICIYMYMYCMKNSVRELLIII